MENVKQSISLAGVVDTKGSGCCRAQDRDYHGAAERLIDTVERASRMSECLEPGIRLGMSDDSGSVFFHFIDGVKEMSQFCGTEERKLCVWQGKVYDRFGQGTNCQ